MRATDTGNFYRQLLMHQYQNLLATANHITIFLKDIKNMLTFKKWSKRFRLFVTFNFVFALSIAFPVFTSFMKNVDLLMIGYIDVIIAVVLIVISIAIYVMRKRKTLKPCWNLIAIYKWILVAPMVLMLLYFAFPSHSWNIILGGLSWRVFLLSLVLEDLYDIYRRQRKKIIRRQPIAIN
jgi:hypothetical protein